MRKTDFLGIVFICSGHCSGFQTPNTKDHSQKTSLGTQFEGTQCLWVVRLALTQVTQVVPSMISATTEHARFYESVNM